jgi:histidinol dehydrogenase
MTAIPAKAAGVKNVIMVTPPGKITAGLLFAAKTAGVDSVYRVGGPWSIAALAFGTETVPRVDMIVGPGNKFINEAKRQVFGTVGIDSLAGPSEIAIIADDSANERFIAQDILAQLEHDPDAKAYLYTDSLRLLRVVNKILFGKAGRKQLITVKCSIERAVELVNKLAPEHLELVVKNAKKLVSRVRNAGAVFVGNYSPVAAGDYWAGPSHTLPTGSSARFSSGVSVSTFLKRTSYIEMSKKSLISASEHIKRIAGMEGLIEHKKSIEVREQ